MATSECVGFLRLGKSGIEFSNVLSIPPHPPDVLAAIHLDEDIHGQKRIRVDNIRSINDAVAMLDLCSQKGDPPCQSETTEQT